MYAAFASFRERGDRSYWLLVTKSVAEQAKPKGPIEVVGGSTIRVSIRAFLTTPSAPRE